MNIEKKSVNAIRVLAADTVQKANSGHPMHAYDYDKITGKKLIARRAIEGEELLSGYQEGGELQ